jgi:hypothetical protein
MIQQLPGASGYFYQCAAQGSIMFVMRTRVSAVARLRRTLQTASDVYFAVALVENVRIYPLCQLSKTSRRNHYEYRLPALCAPPAAHLPLAPCPAVHMGRWSRAARPFRAVGPPKFRARAPAPELTTRFFPPVFFGSGDLPPIVKRARHCRSIQFRSRICNDGCS